MKLRDLTMKIIGDESTSSKESLFKDVRENRLYRKKYGKEIKKMHTVFLVGRKLGERVEDWKEEEHILAALDFAFFKGYKARIKEEDES